VIVFAADPGVQHCGLALIEVEGAKRRLLDSATIHTDAATPHEQRLDAIAHAAMPMMRRAQLVGLEEQGNVWQGHSREGTTNAGAMKAGDVLSVLRGLAIAANIPRHVMRPQTIRSLLGIGASGKDVTGTMVRLIVQGVPAVRAISQHAVDAISIAVAAEKKHRAGLLVQGRIPGTLAPPKPRRTRKKAGRHSAPTLPGPDHTNASARKNREVLNAE
jgi:Holliday junction resolvasome RuvABC endonuclease subunit